MVYQALAGYHPSLLNGDGTGVPAEWHHLARFQVVPETCRCSQKKKKTQRSSVANLKETEKSENLEIWCKCQKISWFHMLRHLVRLLHTSQAGPPLRCPRFPRSGSWPAKWRVQCLEILVATNASQIQEILVIHVEKTKPWVFGKPRIMLDSSTNQ